MFDGEKNARKYLFFITPNYNTKLLQNFGSIPRLHKQLQFSRPYIIMQCLYVYLEFFVLLNKKSDLHSFMSRLICEWGSMTPQENLTDWNVKNLSLRFIDRILKSAQRTIDAQGIIRNRFSLVFCPHVSFQFVTRNSFKSLIPTNLA